MLSFTVQIFWVALVFFRIPENSPDTFKPAEAHRKVTHGEKLWPGHEYLEGIRLPYPFPWFTPKPSISSSLNIVFRSPERKSGYEGIGIHEAEYIGGFWAKK